MCYSNGKIDSLRSKPNWLISLWLLLEIVSAGWMARDRDGEAHLPPPMGVGTWCALPPERGLGLYLRSLKLHWAGLVLKCLRSSVLFFDPGICRWPVLSTYCSWSPAGHFGVFVCSSCSKWDGRCQKQLRTVTQTSQVHLSLLLWWLVNGSGEIYHLHKIPSRSKQSINYQDISLELSPAVN